jgi:hypothetical protein
MDTARIIGGIYFALCAGLSDEGVRLANDILFNIADDPQTKPTDARVLRAIAECASSNQTERPHLELIAGGSA